MTPANPFPGLRPFEEREAGLFFGRTEELRDMLQRLTSERVLTVIGMSGTGKSSLVRAGLIPALRANAGTGTAAGWRIAVMRPGRVPVDALARALDAVIGPPAEDGWSSNTMGLRLATLRRGSLGLVEVVGEAALEPHDRVLIVVDQLEELFRFVFSLDSNRSIDEARAFVQLLAEAINQRERPIYVVLTVQSEFIGRCATLPGLAQIVNRSFYVVPSLTRRGLREIIEQPIAMAGGAVSRRLINRVLIDVGDDPDRLPVLQHALMRTWDRWSSHGGLGEIDLPEYEGVGSLAGALGEHADAAYGSLDSEGQHIAEKVFTALTDTVDGRLVRRPSRVRELVALCESSQDVVIRAVDAFRAPGSSFLMPPPDIPLHDETVVDISHESLIRAWPRMNDWIQLEQRKATDYRHLGTMARWHSEGAAGLLRDPELTQATRWSTSGVSSPWARRYEGDFELTLRYIEESTREHARDQRDRRRRQRQNTILMTALVVLSITTVLLGLFLLR